MNTSKQKEKITQSTPLFFLFDDDDGAAAAVLGERELHNIGKHLFSSLNTVIKVLL